MTLDQAIAMWGTYEGLAAVSAGVLLGFIAARLLRRKSAAPIGELTRVDEKNGVVSMAIKNTQGLKAGTKVRLVLMGGLALLLVGCSAFQSGPAQQAVQTLDVACTLGLLQSPAIQQQADELGIPGQQLAEYLCMVPELVEALGQAKQARSIDPGTTVLAEARGRGLL